MLLLVKRFFGSSSDRHIKKLRPVIKKTTDLAPALQSLSDDALKARTSWLKERLEKGETLDQILPDAFATMREAAGRVLGLYPYEVQLIGGLILHQGKITEMRTGEGKTLVATLPVYLNALTGKGVHVVTVNDYLAQRDAEWMGAVYRFLGLSVGCVVHGMSDQQRADAYQADITYATNSELGFDYLRDNMKISRSEMIQRPFHYAIVDEVDSILIDEARTPLIISGPSEKSSDLYQVVNEFIPLLTPEDYEREDKSRSVFLTEQGTQRIEDIAREKGLFSSEHLYADENISLVHHINQALKAHVMFTKDVDYIVRDEKVLLVDEFTGRVMDGRRYSDGLHQALEAKEHVPVEIENQTLASITYQNFFRLYPKLAGMTGTALTDAEEFHSIYKLSVISIPTNKPIQRKDKEDEVYRTFQEKTKAVLDLVKTLHAKKQPILLGTVSIEKSEVFSAFLKKNGVAHQVLNARHHEKEADIIAEAGAPGAITIATNMAGRGTDIKLGGSLDRRLEKALEGIEDEKKRAALTEKITATYKKDRQTVLDAGGLFIIGTERHESRRIDNQLRGRSGRQGDPGGSQFFLSLQDDLMRIFGSERLDDWLVKLGLKEGEAITHPWITRALEKAQQRVESRNFDMRKQLLKYDDIMNEQRKVVYGWRLQLMDAPETAHEEMAEEAHNYAQHLTDLYAPPHTYSDEWNTDALSKKLQEMHVENNFQVEDNTTQDALQIELEKKLADAYQKQTENHGDDLWQQVVYQALLKEIDQGWKEHLYALDHVRQGVHLRSYAQKDPLNEYATEAFRLFESFLTSSKRRAFDVLLRVDFSSAAQELLAELTNRTDLSEAHMQHPEPEKEAPALETTQPEATFDDSSESLPARNAPCPCGSKKRYKNCHGRL